MGAELKNYICALGSTDSIAKSVGKEIAECCGFEFRFFEDPGIFEDLIRKNNEKNNRDNIVAIFSDGYSPEKQDKYIGRPFGALNDPVYILTGSDALLSEEVKYQKGVVYVPENESGSDLTYNYLYNLVNEHYGAVNCLKSLESYRDFFNLAPLPYQSLDENGNFLDVNRKWTDTLGYSKDEVIGRWFGDFISPGSADSFVRNFSEFKKNGEVHDIRFRMIGKNGDPVTVSFDGCIEHYPDGSFKSTHCIFRDISERERTEWELEKARVSLLFSSEPVGWINTDGTVNDANEAACRLTGYSREEISGMDISQFYDEINSDVWNDFIADLREKESVSLEISVNSFDGIKIPYLISFTIFTYNSEEFIFAFGQDISVLKAQEKLLRDNIFSYENYFCNFQGIAYLSTVNWKPLLLRGAVEKITGYSEEEFICGAVSWDHIIFPQDLGELARRDEALRSAPESDVVIDYRIMRKNGDICWVRDSIRNVSAKEGTNYLLAGSLVDITEQKIAEEMNRRNEERYRTLSDASDQAVAVLGSCHKIIFINNFASEILNKSPDEIEGRKINDSEIPGDYREIQDMYSRCINSGESVEGNYSVNSGGKERTFHVRFTPQEDADGSVSYLLTANEITQSIRIENALKSANQKLQLLSEITRHDILNCITALDLYEGMISGEEMSESAKDDLEMIKLLSEQIKNLALFTRDYQNLGSSAPRWNRIDRILGKLNVNLNYEGISFDIPDVKLSVFSDRMIEKVFYILFDNSVRHGGDQMDEIKISFQDEDGMGVIKVKDNGRGISDEDKPDIFLRSFGENTGLGLFLAKEILSITDMSIEESGVFGEGAEFSIRIPPGFWKISG